MKKVKIVFYITAVALVIILIFYRQYIKFNTDGLTHTIHFNYSHDTHYEEAKECKTSIMETKGSFISRVYAIKHKKLGEYNIRFRYLITNPFYNGDIISHTSFTTANEANDDLNRYVCVGRGKYLGCQTIDITLLFDEAEYIPKTSGVITMTIVTTTKKVRSGIDIRSNDKKIAYTKIKIVIP